MRGSYGIIKTSHRIGVRRDVKGGEYIMDANTVTAICTLLLVVIGMIQLSKKENK